MTERRGPQLRAGWRRPGCGRPGQSGPEGVGGQDPGRATPSLKWVSSVAFTLCPVSVANPVLVSSADGVGTKLKIAFLTGRHDTVGQDLVNHCVNDILVQGAEPLFFLDYLATGRLEEGVVTEVVGGVAQACLENGCALLGGETAEMPDFYSAGEYDLAGFVTGVVEREKVLDGSRIKAGDALIGLGSSGLHTNGYSLARKIVFEAMGLGVDDVVPGPGNHRG